VESKNGPCPLFSTVSKRGGFRYCPDGSGPVDVVLRRHATEIEAFHELSHARQYNALGAGGYRKLGTYAREKHVFSEIWKNRDRYNSEDVPASLRYLKRLRTDFNNGLID
jgi:hypothetical protein